MRTFLIIFLITAAASLFANEVDSLRVYKSPSVTVTSIRAEERKSPVPFTTVERSFIKENYTTLDIPMFLNEEPSVYAYSQSGNGIGYSNLSIRGFDQRRISVMINGVPQNDPEDHNVYWIDFPDLAENLESIQVQRGAGLINYGAAAIGGSINLTTSNFTDEPRIRLYSGNGFQNYSGDGDFRSNVSKFLVEINSGLVDNQYQVMGRLSRVNSWGYRRHSWAFLDGYYLSAARYDDNITTQINVFGGPLRDALVYNGLPKAWIKDKNKRRKNLSYFSYDTDGETVLEDWLTPRRNQEIEEFAQPHYEILNDWQINENLSLKSTLFYYTGEGYFDYDGTWVTDFYGPVGFRLTPENGFENAEGPRRAIIRAFVSNKHGGWVPRLVWDNDMGEFTAGAEIRIHSSDHWGKINFAENLPEGYNPDYKFYSNNGKRDIYSAFVRQGFEVDEQLSVSIEAQVVHHSYRLGNEKTGYIPVTFTNINSETVGTDGEDYFDVRYTFINPRLGANFNLDENSNIYSFVAYTSREPRMRNLYAADDSFFGAAPLFKADTTEDGTVRYDFESPLVEPEKMLDFELGYTFRNEHFYFNANGYWMEYFDELVKSGQLDINGNPVDGNAPRTRHAGLELQGAYTYNISSSQRLKLSANATISRNEILEYDFNTITGETVSLKGNSITGFPGLMGNARLSYYVNDLYLSLSVRHIGEFRTDNFDDMINDERIRQHLINDPAGYGYYADNTLDSYTLFNADAAYTFRNFMGAKSLRVHIQAMNLFNELYAAGGEGKEFFPGAELSLFIGFGLEL